MQAVAINRMSSRRTVGSAAAVARIAVSRRRCLCAMASAAAVETVVKAQLAAVVHTLNPANFEPFLADNADKLVIVDYYTDWCGPCKMMAPELERMAAAQDPSKVLFAKINCGADDDSKRLAMAQEIRALPTFKLFKAGQEVDKMTGAKAKVLAELVAKHSS